MFTVHQKALVQSLRHATSCESRNVIFTVSFQQILPLALGFLPLTFSKDLFAGQGILGLEQQ